MHINATDQVSITIHEVDHREVFEIKVAALKLFGLHLGTFVKIVDICVAEYFHRHLVLAKDVHSIRAHHQMLAVFNFTSHILLNHEVIAFMLAHNHLLVLTLPVKEILAVVHGWLW